MNDEHTLRLISSNPSAAKLTGVELDEMINKTIDENFPDLRERGIPQLFAEVVRSKKIAEVSDFYYGDERVIEGAWSFKAFSLPNNCVGVAFENITEHKRAEEKQAQVIKELRDANQNLKDFAHIVSHDLKSPLHTIGSLADWLSKDYADKLDEQGKALIDLLIREIKRVESRIDGILQYSKVEQIKEKIVDVDLNSVVTEVIKMLAPPEHIEIKIENKLPTISCPKIQIEQVFLNLISNAIKFIDKPKGKIKIGGTEDGNCWKFDVADNGPGIKKKHFEKVFQMFQSLDNSNTFDNTGVGLAIVKKIIETHESKIWVESKIGDGSTFFFTWPKKRFKKS